MPLRDEIVEQALALPPDDRAFVADAIAQSLTSGGFASPELAAAWATEIEQRLAAYDRGDVKATDLDVAMNRIRQHLAQHRARKVPS